MELCSILRGSLDGREVWERMDTSVFIVSPFALYLKLPLYYHSSPLSLVFFFCFFFLNRLIYLVFTELGVLAVPGMFPVGGGAGENQCLGFSLG